MAYSIAAEHLSGKALLDCPTPMSDDSARAAAAYRSIADNICSLLDAGKSVAYLVLGDATVYSSYAYVQRLVQERGYDTQIVPGVTSFCAAAAQLSEPLCEGEESLLVIPASAPDIARMLDVPATKVFMKAGRSLDALRDKLAERGALEHASMVANCGLPDERVYPSFADADGQAGYFSLVIVKEQESVNGDRDASA
jgi:precorrin-2/cobalt-factor-2 C20-methyltransferase